GDGAPGPYLRPIRVGEQRQQRRAVGVGLRRADALHGEELLERPRARRGEGAEGPVVEDDVGWDFLRAGGLGAPPPEPLEQRLALGVERRVILGGGRAALARGRRYVVHLQRDGLAVVERLRAERRQLHDRVLAAGDAEVALEDELLVE